MKRQTAAKSTLDLPRVKIDKHHINQFIFSTWQDDWSVAVTNKLHSVMSVLGDWQSSHRRCMKDEIVLYRAGIGHTHLTYLHLEEGSSISVYALSVYSDSSPHFGECNHFAD